jgi:hypothetical protein
MAFVVSSCHRDTMVTCSGISSGYPVSIRSDTVTLTVSHSWGESMVVILFMGIVVLWLLVGGLTAYAIQKG